MTGEPRVVCPSSDPDNNPHNKAAFYIQALIDEERKGLDEAVCGIFLKVIECIRKWQRDSLPTENQNQSRGKRRSWTFFRKIGRQTTPGKMQHVRRAKSATRNTKKRSTYPPEQRKSVQITPQHISAPTISPLEVASFCRISSRKVIHIRMEQDSSKRPMKISDIISWVTNLPDGDPLSSNVVQSLKAFQEQQEKMLAELRSLQGEQQNRKKTQLSSEDILRIASYVEQETIRREHSTFLRRLYQVFFPGAASDSMFSVSSNLPIEKAKEELAREVSSGAEKTELVFSCVDNTNQSFSKKAYNIWVRGIAWFQGVISRFLSTIRNFLTRK